MIDNETAQADVEKDGLEIKGWPNPAYAWYVVCLLLLAYAFAILDRIAIGLLVDPIKRDLSLTDSQIGLLQGLAFAICYTIFGIPLGVLADRWKRVPLLAIGVAIWSAATISCGLAVNFGILFCARIGVGIGEATVTPTSASMIADYFPPERRAKAYGVWMLGTTVGTGMASLFAALAILIGDHLHANHAAWAANLKTWQIAFFIIGLPGLMVGVVLALTVREPKRRGVHVTDRRFPLRAMWEILALNRKAYAMLIAGTVLNVTCIYAYLGWMPTLFIRVHHWSPAKVGSLFALYSMPVALCGSVFGGWAMSWLAKRGRDDAPIIMAAGNSLMVLLVGTVACVSPSPEIALALNAVVGFTFNWSYAAAMTGINLITPNELRGQVTAVYTLFTGLISMTIGAFLVGFLSDHIFLGTAGVAPSLASVYAGCSILALTILLFGRRAYANAEGRSKAMEAFV